MKNGHVPGVRSAPEFMRYNGKDYGPQYAKQCALLKTGNLLLLSYAHLNSALQRKWMDLVTRKHPAISSAVEIGLRNAREWDLGPEHEDVGRYIIDLSNSFMKGAESSFIAAIKFFLRTVQPEFDTWMETNYSGTTLPETGPNSYYQVFYKFGKDRWPKLFGDIGFNGFMDLGTVARRLDKWHLFNEFEDYVGTKAQFTCPQMEKMTVIRALLLLTQVFETEYRQSLPKEQFKILFFAFSGLCFPNVKQAGGKDVWFVKNSADAARLAMLVKADMQHSVLYKSSAKVSSQASVQAKRSRGKKAEQEAAETKKACVKPSEEMNLVITLANHKKRNRFFPEDVAVWQNAAVNEDDEQKSEELCIEHAAVAANFAAWDDGTGVSFNGKNLMRYSALRKELKSSLAECHKSKAKSESADAEAVQAQTMNDLEGGAIQEWQEMLDSADTVLKLQTYLGDWQKQVAKDDTSGMKSFQALHSLFNTSGACKDIDATLAEAHRVWDTFCDNRMRNVAAALPAIIADKGVMPQEVEGIIADQQAVKMIGFGRAKTMIAIVGQTGIGEAGLAKQLLVHSDEICNVDIFIHDRDLWVRIWKFLMLPSDGNMDTRLDTIKMLVKPPESSLRAGAAREPEYSAGSGGAQAKNENQQLASKVTVPLITHFDNLSVVIAPKTKDMPATSIQFRILKSFMRQLEGYLWSTLMEEPKTTDVGYSYLCLAHDKPSDVAPADGQPAQELPRAKKQLVVLWAPRSEVRMNFWGGITFNPKAGCMRLGKCWGMDFFLECPDLESGDMVPAWLVPTVKSEKSEKPGKSDEQSKDNVGKTAKAPKAGRLGKAGNGKKVTIKDTQETQETESHTGTVTDTQERQETQETVHEAEVPEESAEDQEDEEEDSEESEFDEEDVGDSGTTPAKAKKAKTADDADDTPPKLAKKTKGTAKAAKAKGGKGKAATKKTANPQANPKPKAKAEGKAKAGKADGAAKAAKDAKDPDFIVCESDFHTGDWEFSYKGDSGKATAVSIAYKVPYLKLCKGCGAKKGMAIKRMALPDEVQAKQCKDIATALKKKRKVMRLTRLPCRMLRMKGLLGDQQPHFIHASTPSTGWRESKSEREQRALVVVHYVYY